MKAACKNIHNRTLKRAFSKTVRWPLGQPKSCGILDARCRGPPGLSGLSVLQQTHFLVYILRQGKGSSMRAGYSGSPPHQRRPEARWPWWALDC
eukprot:6204728-Pleurochrysis_carterae.AAC.1